MDLKDEIEKVAYELFERDGGQHGKDREHWLEAEEIVKARHTPGQKVPGRRSRKGARAREGSGPENPGREACLRCR